MRIAPSALAITMACLLPCIAPAWSFAQPTAASEVPTAEGASDAAEDPAFAFDGFAALRYVHRRAQGGGDQAGETAYDRDAFLQIRMDATMPREQRYEAHFHAAGRRDLDGGSETATYAPFEDIGDAWQSSTSAQVYEAHFDVNYLFRSLEQVRLGRQAGTRDEPIFFDGVATDLDLSRHLRATVYGGYAVHFFELQRESTDDPLAGAGVDFLPHPATEISLDYLATRDVRSPESQRDDRLTSLRLRQHLSRNWRGSLKARYLNGASRDGRLRVLGFIPTVELTVSGSYYRQFATLNELTTEQDPYSDVIGQSRPYHTVDVKLRWQPGDTYAFDVGYYGRELLEDEEQSPFNREFSRSYLVVDIQDALVTGLSLATTAERWESLETTAETIGMDLGYRADKGRRAARFSAGSYYTLYVYDHYLELGERTGVRTHYLRASLPVGASFTVDGTLERETGLDTYDTAKVGTRYDY